MTMTSSLALTQNMVKGEQHGEVHFQLCIQDNNRIKQKITKGIKEFI
jgi:hypothetical protein